MKVDMGSTTVKCKFCGDVTVIKNNDLEVMTGFKRHSCEHSMTDYEFARLKMHYYFMLFEMYKDHYGPLVERFEYNIHLWPHYEVKESETNGNHKGV